MGPKLWLGTGNVHVAMQGLKFEHGATNPVA